MSQTATDWDAVERALQAWVVAGSGLPASNVIWSGYGLRRPTPDGQWISMLIHGIQQDGLAWTDTEDNPVTFPPVTCTVDGALNLRAPAHGLITGDGPVWISTTGELPAGVQPGTDYWVVVVDPDTLALAARFPDSVQDAPVLVALTSAGQGVQTITAIDRTRRAGEEVLEVVRMILTAKLSVQCYGGSPTGLRNPRSILSTVSAMALLPTVRDKLEAAGVGVSSAGPVQDVGALLNSTKWEPRAQVEFTLWLTSQVSETGTFIETVDVTLESDEQTRTFSVPE